MLDLIFYGLQKHFIFEFGVHVESSDSAISVDLYIYIYIAMDISIYLIFNLSIYHTCLCVFVK